MDLGFNGSKFTWRGMRNGQLVEERLDRGMINVLWQECWSNITITHDSTLVMITAQFLSTMNLGLSKGNVYSGLNPFGLKRWNVWT